MVEEERKIKYEITTCLLSRRERGGLQSPSRTVTPAVTTLPCKAWSFTEGNTPRHHVREYNHMFPH
jgi:hypothetical protein